MGGDAGTGERQQRTHNAESSQSGVGFEERSLGTGGRAGAASVYCVLTSQIDIPRFLLSGRCCCCSPFCVLHVARFAEHEFRGGLLCELAAPSCATSVDSSCSIPVAHNGVHEHNG